MSINIMIDIETMGTSTNAAILSIAAVKFAIETGETYDEFYETITLSSCEKLRLNIEADTVIWWLSQSESARRALMIQSKISITEALEKLTEFIHPDSIIWANSPSFDLVILKNAYRKAGKEAPWKYWNERCVRTLVALHPSVKEEFFANTEAHNALTDCYYQIGYTSQTWRELKGINDNQNE